MKKDVQRFGIAMLFLTMAGTIGCNSNHSQNGAMKSGSRMADDTRSEMMDKRDQMRDKGGQMMDDNRPNGRMNSRNSSNGSNGCCTGCGSCSSCCK